MNLNLYPLEFPTPESLTDQQYGSMCDYYTGVGFKNIYDLDFAPQDWLDRAIMDDVKEELDRIDQGKRVDDERTKTHDLLQDAFQLLDARGRVQWTKEISKVILPKVQEVVDGTFDLDHWNIDKLPSSNFALKLTEWPQWLITKKNMLRVQFPESRVREQIIELLDQALIKCAATSEHILKRIYAKRSSVPLVYGQFN